MGYFYWLFFLLLYQNSIVLVISAKVRCDKCSQLCSCWWCFGYFRSFVLPYYYLFFYFFWNYEECHWHLIGISLASMDILDSIISVHEHILPCFHVCSYFISSVFCSLHCWHHLVLEWNLWVCVFANCCEWDHFLYFSIVLLLLYQNYWTLYSECWTLWHLWVCYIFKSFFSSP